MKKMLNVMLIILMSSSLINAESSKFTGVMSQVTSMAKSKADQISKAFGALSANNEALRIVIPVNLIAIALAYALIEGGKKDRALAEDVQNNPQSNLNVIRDYCANYQESHTITGYSKGQTVTATVTSSNPSLFQTYINVKSDPEKLKDFAFLISKYMRANAAEKTAAGYFIPVLSLLLTGIGWFSMSGMAVSE